MHYGQLGISELKISEIGFGCMSIGANEQEGIPLIQKAFAQGINFFDTADIYADGLNEILVGKALQGIRDKVVIASKAGNVVRKDGSGLDWNPSKKHILSSAEKSLKRLQTDYIDLYMLHGGTMNDPIDETIEAFELLKQQGKIRYYGTSSIRPNMIREYMKRSSIVSVMTQYSLLDRRPEEETLNLLLQNNMGVLVRGALAQGLLINKVAKSYIDHSLEEVQRASELVGSLSNADRSGAQVAIRYVLHHPATTSAIIGIRTEEQLSDAVGVSSSSPLTDHEAALLQKEVRQNFYKDHR